MNTCLAKTCTGGVCFLEVLKEFERFKYNGPKVLVGAGDSELFTNDVLGLDNVAEPNLSEDLRIFEKKQVDFNL